MTAPKTYRRRSSLRYEFGFRTPTGELVTCSSLQEAQFFVEQGAQLMLREIETKVGDWTQVDDQ